MIRSSFRLAALAGAAAFAAAACGSSGSSHTAAPAAGPTTAASETTMTTMMSGAMALPPGAENMKVAITSPAAGTKVTANTVTLGVQTSGYNDTCDLAGKPQVDTISGHYHVLIDKSLVNMYCTPTATVSLQNVKPGMHTLTVLPALNDHAEVEQNAQSVTIDYEPTSPLPEITDATAAGAPTIKILSPANGATVSGPFDVTVQLTNFHANCDLYGKPGVAGYGHWHLNLDSLSGPMMGMAGMMGMSCQNVIHITTTGLKSGEHHTLIAVLVDNSHAPLNPTVSDKVDVTIG
jgi:hypothetical protein